MKTLVLVCAIIGLLLFLAFLAACAIGVLDLRQMEDLEDGLTIGSSPNESEGG